MREDFCGITRQATSRPRPGEAVDLRVVHTVCEAVSEIPQHRHEHPFLSFLMAGSYGEGAGDQWNDCHPNALTWHPAHDAHEVRHGNETVSSVQIEFLGSDFDEWRIGKMLPSRRITGEVPAARAILHGLIREMDFADEFSALSIRGSAYQALALTARCFNQSLPSGDSLVARIQAAIQDAFPEAPDVDLLARSLGMSTTQLAVQYRRHAGEGIGLTARRLRVERACEMLPEQDRPLSQIAQDCGFCDQSHFTRVFARLMRSTPGKYRESLTKSAGKK